MINQFACPVCYSKDLRKLWNVDCDSAAQHFILKEKDRRRHRRLSEIIKRLWGRSYCIVLECRKCGFCFSDPYIAGDKEFYDIAYQKKKGGYPNWRWEFQKTVEAMAPAASTITKLRLLEVGAGNGGFIKAVIKNKIAEPENIVCTEYSDYGRRNILSLGAQCYSQNIIDIGFHEKFDSVVMFQVLEHMDRLDSLFMKIRSILLPGGTLFIAVPNNSRISFNENNGGLLDMPPNHIGRWTKRAFKIVGKRHNFEIIDYDIEPLRIISLFKEIAKYKYLRLMQQRGSLANYAERQSIRIKRIACRCVLFLPIALSLPFMGLKMNCDLGESQWIHYSKE
jgi:2-polyprenyl-3-methyl-5-hydroxy-6-metoxy-1,4-benzoquinol methylase